MIVAVAALALLVGAALALLPVKIAVEPSGSYSCSSPLVSSIASGAKQRWQVDTLVAKAAHPEASLDRLPDMACGHATSTQLRWALFAGALGCLLAFGVLTQRALAQTRGDGRVAAPVVAAGAEPATTESRFRHVPALDGMRGLAVLAVLAFHAGLSWARGGFLGVDAFFVLSGYLITSLLLTEWRAKGSIALGAFWSRRARRLLPALLLVLAAVALYARYISDPNELSSLRFDAFATLGYAANWRFIFTNVGYFGAYAAPSPLRHMWSLAVEEQFYLLWPPFALLVLSLLRSRRALFWITSALTLASVVAMQALYRPGVDPTRVYYGTDTRAQTVLIGAALATLAPDLTWASTAARRRALVAVGVVAALFVAWAWITVDGRSSWLYRGGLTAIALAVAGVIASVVGTTSVLGRMLSWRPLMAVGRISYGLYLWHWPIFLVITRARTGLWGIELLTLRLVVTFGLAIASFVLVERPIRRGALRHGWAAVATPLALGATVVLLLLTTVSPSSRGQLAAPARPRLARDIRVVALGDSVALTLLDPRAPEGMSIDNAARLGCGVLDGESRGRGEPATSCRPPDPIRQWRSEVDRRDPDVVALLIGRWEVHDRRLDGRWVHIGDPTLDAHLADRIDRGLTTLTARGAHVVLMTAPYFDSLERPDGGRWPEDDPSRVDRFNRILRDVASRHRGAVSVFDLNRVLSPNHRYARVVDGVTVRKADGIHITAGGVRVVGRTLLPKLARAGEKHRAERLARTASP